MAQTPILEVKNLVKSFGSVTAVNDLSFSIRPGICFGLLGPNGAGKTTTVELIEGVTQPDSGKIYFKGKLKGKTFKSHSGIQFQQTTLQDFLSVAENLKLFASFYERTLPFDELVRICALEEFIRQDVRKLSGGQRQRVALALSLINDPQLLFLDEPTMGLDPQARQNFWQLIERIKRQDKTIVLTTHYMEEAYTLCDEICIIDRGRVLMQGEPKTLVNKHNPMYQITLPLSALEGKRIDEKWVFEELDHHISIKTKNINATLTSLMEHGIVLDELSIRKPTLEDLFLDLTGHSLRD